MKITILFKAAAIVAVCLSGSASAAPATLKARLDAYVDSYARSGLFSGVVLVERHGKIVLLKASGMADRSFGTPIRPDTKFHIASLSKPITSVAIGRLVDQGKLTYETKIGTLVAGIPNGERISIEQLLTHYSGLDSPDRASGASEWARLPHTTEQLVERIRTIKPLFEPGEKYEYANANYWLLAHVIEKLSGLSYGDFLKREIFDPLGMSDTAHRGDLLAVTPLLATGYQLDGPGRYRVGEMLDWTTKTGNGSIYSTAADLMKFYRGMIGGKLLSSETTNHILGTGKRVGIPWGRRNPETYGRQSIYFNGRSPGFGSFLEGFVDDDTSFVILSNLYVYAPTAMAEGIGSILWDKPYENMEPIRLYPASDATLKPYEATYQFGPDFHVRNGRARIASAGDHLKMHWDAGDRVTILLPVGPGRFFDPTFWATIDFVDVAGGKEIRYRSLGFPKIYEAKRVD